VKKQLCIQDTDISHMNIKEKLRIEIQLVIFWAVTPSSVVGIYEGFRGTCYLSLGLKYAGSHFNLDDTSHLLGFILTKHETMIQMKKVVINFVTFSVLVT